MTRARGNFLGPKSRKPLFIAGILFLLLVPAALLAARHPTAAQAEWFDTSWSYRTRIDVANATGANQTDFQVQISTDTAAPVAAGKMLSNCNDLRFTDNKGKLLNYWIEPTTCNTTNTKIFVKVPALPTSGASIYMYYGNAGASAMSSDTNTFLRVIPNLKFAYDMDEASWTNDCSTGTVLDKSGNAYNAKSCPNTTGPTGGTAGKYGNAGTFDGAVQYLDTGFSYSASYNTSFTYSVWINPTSINTGGKVKTIIGKTDFDLDLYQLDNKVRFEAWNSGGTDIFAITSNGSLTAGSWTQFTVVYDANTHKATIYLNGAYDNSQNALTNSFKASPETLKIGKGYGWGGSPTPLFGGIIDNVRIYNGYALNANEVADLFGTAGSNQGYVTTNYPGKELVRKYSTGITYSVTGTEENSLGPVLWLKLDEGTGNILKDSSGKGNNSNAISGSIKWATDDQCVSGKCLEFPASAGAVAFSVPNSNSLNFGTSSFTVEGWGFFRDYTYPKNTFMLKKTGACYSTPNAANTGFDINTSYNANGFNVCINDGTNRANGVLTFDTGYKPADFQNQWTHFAIVYDRVAGRIKAYVNGVKQSNEFDISYVTGSITNTSQSVIIGSSYGWSTDGKLDDIRLYPQARTAAQILSDYNSRGSNTTSSTIGVQPTTFLNSGLVGYLKMDEATWSGTTNEVYDWSGHNASATAQGPTNNKAYPAPGLYGNGGKFDGFDNYLSSGNVMNVGTSDWTTSIWFKTSTTANAGLIGKTEYSANQGRYGIFIDAGNIGTVFNTITLGNNSITTPVAPYADGKWHMVTMTVQRKGLEILYVDAIQKATKDVSADAAYNMTNTDPLWFGAYPASGGGSPQTGYYFNGMLDEARIYNRALSANEVTALYQWAPGPYEWWKMDEKTSTSVSDSSGSNINSTSFTGSPSWVPGKYGSALSFGGTNQAVNFGNVGGITGNISVSAWVNWRQFKNYGVIVQRGNGGSANTFNYSIWSYSNSINCFFGDGSSNNGASTSTLPSLNQWHHIECVADGSNVYLYIDGVQANKQSQTITPSGTIAGTQLTISEPTYTIDGLVDDVKVYNYGRTPAQVLQDMNGDHPVGGSPVGSQLLYWKFDEGISTTAHDSGPNNYSGVYACSSATSCAAGIFSWADGKINKGVYFNPTLNSDRPYFHRSPVNISSTVGTKMTWTFWLNPNASQIGSGWIFRNGNSTDENYGVNLGAYSTGKYKVSFTGYDTNFRTVTSTNYLVPSSTWSHLTVVYSQGQWVKLYVNGVFQEQITWPFGATVQAVSELDVGANSGAYQNYNGYLDEFKIYNDELTADQIKVDMNANAGLNFGSGAASESGQVIDGPGNPPVGYWSFDEKTGSTVNDKSGNNNPGTWNGTLGAQWTIGKYNAGGNFNGTNNYVSVNDNSVLDPTSTITYMAWFKGSASNAYIVGKPYTTTGSPYHQYMVTNRTDTHKFEYCINIGGVCTNLTSNNAIDPTIWNHVAVVYDGTNVLLYINGKLDKSTPTTGSITTYATSLQIGRGNGALYFPGSIDEVKVYNYARTPAQISYDYNRGAPIAMWRFDECQGLTMHDASGNSYDGTWAGGTAAGSCTTPSTAWGNGALGKINSSLNFSAAANDYVSVPAGITLGNDMTIAAWIKTGTAAQRPVVSDRTGGGRTYFGVSTTGKGFLYYNSASPASISSNKTLSDSVWHHLVFTRFGNTSTIYIDGIQDNQITQTGYVSQNTAIRIGHDVANVSEYFNGQIDDVRIYGYALSASQVKNLYNDNSSVRYAPVTGTP